MRKLIDKITFDHVIIVAAAIVGFSVGTHRLSDNSMFVHLRTGIEILNSHHVPHSDPYSFSAHGSPWIDQSWLPEIIYAESWRVGGGHLFQAFNIVLFTAVGALLGWLSRTGSQVRTLLVALMGIGLGYSQWTARPTEFGLLFFVITVAVVVRQRSSWWLFVVGLLWVNSHGSWPLGLLWIVAAGAGTKLDRGNIASYVRYTLTLAGGILVGGLVSPAGITILTFPASAFGPRVAIFRYIAEWQSPNFRDGSLVAGSMNLVVILVTVVILTRKRQPWAVVLPVLVFLAASLSGLRNLPMLGVVVVVPLVAVLRKRQVESSEPDPGVYYVPPSSSAGAIGAVMIAVLALVAALLTSQMVGQQAFNFSSYPVAGVQWLDSHNLGGRDHRVAAMDVVGCYRILIDGKNANVFIDDRYDMYPVPVASDSLSLSRVNDEVSQVLYRYKFDAVLWSKKGALTQFLAINPGWKQVWSDKDWAIFEPVKSATLAS